jgi:hypothetical protein
LLDEALGEERRRIRASAPTTASAIDSIGDTEYPPTCGAFRSVRQFTVRIRLYFDSWHIPRTENFCFAA